MLVDFSQYLANLLGRVSDIYHYLVEKIRLRMTEASASFKKAMEQEPKPNTGPRAVAAAWSKSSVGWLIDSASGNVEILSLGTHRNDIIVSADSLSYQGRTLYSNDTLVLGARTFAVKLLPDSFTRGVQS